MPSSRDEVLSLPRELLGIGNAGQRAPAAHAEMLAVHWRARGYLTARSSTSNTSVALGGITPPAPRAP